MGAWTRAPPLTRKGAKNKRDCVSPCNQERRGAEYHHAIRKEGGLSITTARAQPCVCVHPESTRGHRHPPLTTKEEEFGSSSFIVI